MTTFFGDRTVPTTREGVIAANRAARHHRHTEIDVCGYQAEDILDILFHGGVTDAMLIAHPRHVDVHTENPTATRRVLSDNGFRFTEHDDGTGVTFVLKSRDIS